MSILESIRKRGKLIAIVIGGALLAFILGDMISSGKALFSSQDFNVLSVNGEAIHINDFEQKVNETENYVKLIQGINSLDAETSQQIRSSVWETTLRDALLKKTFNSLGLEISLEELNDMVLGKNIHPVISQTFADPNTGQLNKEIIQNILTNLDKDPKINQIWLYLENYIKEDRRYTKYITLVTKGLYVTSLEIETEDFERKYTVDVEIVGKSIDFKDTTMAVTDKEIQDYYKKHINFFKNYEETRDISYITFDIIPLKSDTLDAFNKASKMVEELKVSDDEQSFVNLKSSRPDLVRFYSAKELEKMGLDSVLFNLEIGKTYGPFLQYNSYQIAKITERISDRPDTVSARHILISPENPSIGNFDKAQRVADSLVAVLKAGGDFKMLAAQYSDDPGSKDKGGLYENFTEGSMVTEFNDYCFSKKIGEIGTVKTNYGIHIIEVTEAKSFSTKLKLAFVSVDIMASAATYDFYYTKATAVRGKITDKETFDKITTEEKIIIKEAKDINKGAYTIPGLENVREVVRWLYESKEGAVSNVFEMPEKYVVVLNKNINEQGFKPVEKVKDVITNSVRQEKLVDKLFTDEFEKADISNLDNFAAKLKVTKEPVSKVSFNAYQVATIGYEPAVLASISKFEVGKVYGPIKGKNGVYVVKATQIYQPEALTAEELKNQKLRMKSSLQSRANYQALTALKGTAEIIDNRAKFF